MSSATDEHPELKEISHYRLLRKLGAGGMGDVYLAEDQLLRRKVALKVLHSRPDDDDSYQRLLREARAASVLDHPNICTVHEVGEDQGRRFLVMQFVEGVTLAGCLQKRPPDLLESLDIAAQISEALAEAHARGIVHRDIKPQNVMVTEGGRVKVLDFGLAKRLSIPGADGSHPETSSLQSQPGAIAGTLAYMSPEQTRGGPVDCRTDIFSFGTLLYEMLSGHHPFKRRTGSETLAAIQTLEPPPLSRMARVPPKLEWIVEKCLKKGREQRYPSASELSLDLQSLRRDLQIAPKVDSGKRSARVRVLYALIIAAVLAILVPVSWRYFKASASVPESIAVLPFVNETGMAEGDEFCRGIAERLTGILSRDPNLRVKNPPPGPESIDPLKAGRALDAAAVLYGKMSQNRDRFVFWAGLLNTKDGSLQPAGTFDIARGDVVAVQAELVGQVIDMLHLRLSPDQQRSLGRREPVSDEAWRLYLKGLGALQERTPGGMNDAIEFFRRTISLDPKYAQAFAGLANAYALKACPGECIQAARENAKTALKLDDTLGEAHAALGFILSHYDWKWKEAEEEFKQALWRNPNYSTGYLWYADYLLIKGRFNEAAEKLRRAHDIDPQSAIVRADLSLPYYYGGNPDLAVEESRRAVEAHPGFWVTHLYLARALLMKGDYQGAIDALEGAWKLAAGGQLMPAYEVYAYGRWGRPDKAREAFLSLETQARGHIPSPYYLAIAHIGLGERDKALEYLEKGVESKDPYLRYLEVDPLMDTMRSEPRFTKLLERVRHGQ